MLYLRVPSVLGSRWVIHLQIRWVKANVPLFFHRSPCLSTSGKNLTHSPYKQNSDCWIMHLENECFKIFWHLLHLSKLNFKTALVINCFDLDTSLCGKYSPVRIMPYHCSLNPALFPGFSICCFSFTSLPVRLQQSLQFLVFSLWQSLSSVPP